MIAGYRKITLISGIVYCLCVTGDKENQNYSCVSWILIVIVIIKFDFACLLLKILQHMWCE